jgi:UDP-glucuronate 4-epimerase
MALFIFTKAILEGKPIDVFNHGQMRRDFTYIDDIVEGVYRTSEAIATPDPNWSGERPNPATSAAPYRIYNIGNSQPVSLDHFISVIERKLDRHAIRNDLPMQPGDVTATYADIEALEQAVGFRPSTPIEVGIGRFVDWYRDYYRV